MTAFVELAYTYYADIKRAQSPRRSRRATAILRPARSAGARSRTRRRSGNCYRLYFISATNAAFILSNTYDHRHRRIRKTTQSVTHDFIYDEWNLLRETILSNGVSSTVDYFWGADISGTLQGAGGVGGLLASRIGDALFFPLYDANGNITGYVSESGAVVACYAYDAFGNTISQSGPMADTFRFRFSTKYHDPETGHYYYGYRFYSPELGRWLNRDPIDEEGGINLYGFVGNNGLNHIDPLGEMAMPLWDDNYNFYNNVVEPHFNKLMKHLTRELQALCPKKLTRWAHPGRGAKGAAQPCCDPSRCKDKAQEMAAAFGAALKAVWWAEYRSHGNVRGRRGGNWRVWRGSWKPSQPWGDTNYGDGSNIDDWQDGNGLKCGGWAALFEHEVVSLFDNGGDDDCWLPQGIIRGRGLTRHTWFRLHAPGGTKDLDPWPSGGWSY